MRSQPAERSRAWRKTATLLGYRLGSKDDRRRRNRLRETRACDSECALAGNNNGAFHRLAVHGAGVSWVEVRQVVVLVPEHRMVFPTQAVIESQILSTFQSSWAKTRIVLRHGVHIRLYGGGDSGVIRITQKEGRERCCRSIAQQRAQHRAVEVVSPFQDVVKRRWCRKRPGGGHRRQTSSYANLWST